MLKRMIPTSGEQLPSVGLGTWQTFDLSDSLLQQSHELAQVLRLLAAAGGSVVDTSPMYGRAEAVLGELLRSVAPEQMFIATKVWTHGQAAGERQMRESARLIGRPIDLMQIHNLVDWRVHLRTLRRWKDEGLIRYIGITHYTASAYADLEQVLATENVDFVQFAYSPRYRAAEQRLLPLCADRGVAVMVNRPFEEGSALRSLRDRPLPASVAAYASTWADATLKWILAHPVVTCVIPATGSPSHMAANLAAGEGRLPTEEERNELVKILG